MYLSVYPEQGPRELGLREDEHRGLIVGFVPMFWGGGFSTDSEVQKESSPIICRAAMHKATEHGLPDSSLLFDTPPHPQHVAQFWVTKGPVDRMRIPTRCHVEATVSASWVV